MNIYIGDPETGEMTCLGEARNVQVQTVVTEMGEPVARYLLWRGAFVEVPVRWCMDSYRLLVMMAVAYAQGARN